MRNQSSPPRSPVAWIVGGLVSVFAVFALALALLVYARSPSDEELAERADAAASRAAWEVAWALDASAASKAKEAKLAREAEEQRVSYAAMTAGARMRALVSLCENRRTPCEATSPTVAPIIAGAKSADERKLLVEKLGELEHAQAAVGAAAVEVNADDAPEGLAGGRGLGERCRGDCQCETRECKGFRCVKRDYNQHPLLSKGSECVFAGDCASCDCAGFKCR